MRHCPSLPWLVTPCCVTGDDHCRCSSLHAQRSGDASYPHRRLYVVAHHAAATVGHGASIGVGQGNLLVRRLKHPYFELFQPRHLLLQGSDLVFQALDLVAGCSRLLAIGTCDLAEITFDTRNRNWTEPDGDGRIESVEYLGCENN